MISQDRENKRQPGKIRRREALQLGAAAAGIVALSGCEPMEQQLTPVSLPTDAFPPPPTRRVAPSVRLLNRAAFGPRPGDVERVDQIGLAAFVEEQLHPPTPETKDPIGFLKDHLHLNDLDDDPACTWRVRALGDMLTTDTGLLFDEDDHRLVQALRQATLLRAIYSRHQLLERMVEFWSDHFNIYAFKGAGPQYKVVDDQTTIRQHAFGRFRDLLGASAHSAAMLGYLDNTVNRKGVPNENYARELMELHTLGVNGGYTQHDVQQVARCLTGWSSERHWRRGAFVFNAAVHDNGEKVVLGHRIPPGGGVRDGERVLDILAAHPSTARHLATKLCIYFLGEAPDEMVKRLAGIYLKTHGDIRSVVRPLLNSPELLESKPILKRPFDYLVSTCRALNVDTDAGLPLQQHLEKMGQPLFAWPMPDGFPERASAWTGTLIPRWNYAMDLSANRLKNTLLNWTALTDAGEKRGLSTHDSLVELAFACRASDPSLAPVRECQKSHPNPAEYGAVVLMSPEFQWR
ncbi:MAG TPA: DUF1800 domain-containing protein [Armatimonadota bacterium]|nr:DUF1800 domain-containing protein [Armatimonadota bacterium]